MATESCEPTLNRTAVNTSTATRNNYFSGKRMNAKDLILEQRYFIEKIKRMNSELTGYGIVNGLTIPDKNASKQELQLNPGIGVDSHGNFLVLYEKKLFPLARKLEDGDYIYLRFLEQGQQRVPREDDEACGSECCFNHIAEEMEIVLDKEFLNLEANDICHGDKKRKIQHKVKELKTKSPFLLLGRYYKGQDGSGNLDTSDRVELHTNAELSKLLCDIEQHHVRSLNGLFGDVSAISSINGKKPTAIGEFELLAGNNISISSDENSITVATKGGFHETYSFMLEASVKHEIVHQQNRYPMVDIYKAIEVKNTVMAHESKELLRIARDLNMQPEVYFESIAAQPLELYIDKFENPTREGVEGVKKRSTYAKSKKTTKNVFDTINIKEYSPAVIKKLGSEIQYNLPTIMVSKHYKYEKVVGGKEVINVKVTHLDSNRVEIQNLYKTKGISLMVILST